MLRLLLFACLALTPLLATGCASPDLGRLRVGAPRAEIERQLGAAVQQVVTADGVTTATYEYTPGLDDRILQVIAQLSAGLPTGGLAPLATAPLGLFVTPRKVVTVRYGPEQTVIGVNTPPPPGSAETSLMGARSPADH